jgi:hypothetical protein
MEEKQQKEIVIKIRTRDIKKVMYFSVLIVLILLLVLQYFFPISCKCDGNKTETKETNLTTQTIPAPIEPLEPEQENQTEIETQAENQTINETQTNQTETNETEEVPEVAITGELYFKVNDVKTVVKAEDWAKVTEIEYTISNAQSIDFIPKIYIYCYDDNDPSDVKDYIDETIILPKLKAGNEITEVSDVSISFNEIDKEKTLKLVLKDDDENTLKTIYEKFTVSS